MWDDRRGVENTMFGLKLWFVVGVLDFAFGLADFWMGATTGADAGIRIFVPVDGSRRASHDVSSRGESTKSRACCVWANQIKV